MKRRTTSITKNRLSSNSRRRQLLKRVHKKVALRRQHYQIIEESEKSTQTC